MEKITVSYGVNSDGCKFAILQCSNPTAKDILMEVSDHFNVYLSMLVLQIKRINYQLIIRL